MKWCPVCEREVTSEEIVRAYEYEKGRYVTFSPEELEALPGPDAHKVDILDFVDLSQVDPVYFEKSFFLEPREGAEKAYRLLLTAMEDMGKVATAKVAIRAKESLALVRSYNSKFLMLETMYWADEVRTGEELMVPGEIQLDNREMKLATTLIQTLSAEFDAQKYRNRQREALSELVQKKIRGQEIVREPEVRAPVIDLVEALRRSVEKAEASGKPAAKRRRKRTGEARADASPP